MENSTIKEEVKETLETAKTTNSEETTKEVVTVHPNLVGNVLPLKRLNEKFIYELMEVPTASHHEFRMVTFILLWAKRNGIKYEMDSYGNLYLTKGEVSEGEFYPCVTAHLDTVQTKQVLFAKAGAKLDVKTKEQDGKHRIYVDGFGIGGDDKAGLLLGLTMFSYFDKLKACFFLEEEVGCCGSKHLDKEWFKNVGYVIGYDSPDLNRAAHTCSGTKLMSKDFFEKNGLAEICKKHGLVDFRSEPFTDVVQIREQTNIICMNFGTGYYNCHSVSEYCVIEDMDEALDMGVDIINKLGLTEHKLIVNGKSYGTYNDADSRYFEELNPKNVHKYDYDYNHNNGGYQQYNSNYSGTKSTSTTTPSTSKAEDKINFETIEYTVKKYDEYIVALKEQVSAKCKELDIDFDENFKSIFAQTIEF